MNQNVNVFVDYIGHADLYYSMHALFEKRLGWKLYRPNEDPRWINILTAPVPQPLLGYTQNPIGFEQFKDMEFDYIVTTSHVNEIPFHSLKKLYHPNARFVRQIANVGERPQVAKNILFSMTHSLPKDINSIRYMPEHPPSYIYSPPTVEKKIKSFFNYMREYKPVYDRWNKAKAVLSDYEFRMHGGKNEDHTVPQADLPASMQDAMFIWHTKPMGCCGYTARQALCCGRPLIVNKFFSKTCHTLAHEYLEDGINCIDIDERVRTFSQSIALIREWTNTIDQRCEDVRKSVDRHINFERDAPILKKWLEDIRPGT